MTQYSAHEQSEIAQAKARIKQAKETLRDIEWGRKAREEHQIKLKGLARENMVTGIRAMINDIRQGAPIGYSAALESDKLYEASDGSMILTLVFKPLV